VLHVHDNGIGIAPEVLPRLFELFTQESRASDLVPGGLGVGLAIVRQVAELHGGVAQARSGGAGKGSEFTLRLPRHGPTPLSQRLAGRAASSA
jgi:signal transduction histidine kinase